MSLDYYNAQQKYWVSPRLILVYYDQLLKLYGKNLFATDFKKVHEAKAAAIALLGVHKLTKNRFLMQIPVEVNESPDIVTMMLREYNDKPVQMEMQDVEIVEYGENSHEDLSTFLIDEKLDPIRSRKAYDEKTIIICHITKNRVIVNHPQIHNAIKAINPKPVVYLLGRIPDIPKQYRLVRIWPELDNPISFNIVEEGNNYPKPDSLKLSLGTNKKIIFGKSGKPLPSLYEVFELNEKELHMKF